VRVEVVHNMRIQHPFLGSLALAAALVAPAGISIAPMLHGQVDVKIKVGRVYDPVHKDYHQWDDREDKAYRGYLVDNHKEYRPLAKQSKEDRNGYWNWRHEHPDEHR
jgi:hypothetical protein